MGKYFGTDGVRGVANSELSPELAFKLGRSAGYILHKQGEFDKEPTVLIGRDTRISGQLLEQSLISGLLSVGVNVVQLGVIPTPGVAFLVRKKSATAGVMISASHNPAEDNGIKFFGSDGFKLSDEQELEIEKLLDSEDILPRPSAEGLGILKEDFGLKSEYIDFLAGTISGDLSGMKLYLDGANGAASRVMKDLFTKLEAKYSAIGDRSNGLNINENVGSTHPETLAKLVKENSVNAGLAFDGDADRLIAIDEEGEIVNGDKIMFICGKFLAENNKLAKDTIVSTVMSNLGFYKAAEEANLSVETTKVGDRYVVEEMRKNDYNFGGEQSGHIVFLDHNTTGDGLLSAVQLLDVMKQTGKKLSELAAELEEYPQVLINLKVNNKDEIMRSAELLNAINGVEKEMSGNGRVLVRPSGTEPLVRVMTEAPTEDLAREYANKIINTINSMIEN